jgi:hypothetical protein
MYSNSTLKRFAFLLFCSALVLATNDTYAQKKKATDWSKIFETNRGNLSDFQKSFEKAERIHERKARRAKRKGKTLGETPGFEIFKRWEAYVEPRVYPSGDLSLLNNTYPNYLEYLQNQSSTNKKTRNSSWSAVGPFGKPKLLIPAHTDRTGTGRVTFVVVHPKNDSIIFVGTPDGGLWKSIDAGNTYTTNTNMLPITGCAELIIDTGNVNTMYLATGDYETDRRSIGILKSTDGGDTWLPTSLTFTAANEVRITRLLVNPANQSEMIAATSQGTFKTTDGWATNTPGIFPGVGTPILSDMEMKPNDPQVIYTSGVEMFKSVDGGLNWVTITNGLPMITDVIRSSLAVTPADPNLVYVMYSANNNGFNGLYLSTDAGNNFNVRSTTPNIFGYELNGLDAGGQGFWDMALSVSPTAGGSLMTGAINHYESTDSGSTWRIVTHWVFGNDSARPQVHADVHNLIHANNTEIWSCNDGGLFKTPDNGVSWIDYSRNMNISQIVRLGTSLTDSNRIITGMQDNGTNLKISADSFYSVLGGDGGDCFFDNSDNNTVYYSYIHGEMHRSGDNGITDTTIVNGIPAGETSGADFYSNWHQDPVTSTTLYAAGRPALYKSTNRGDNWSAIGTPPGTGNISEFAIAPTNNSVIYAIKKDAVSKSVDGGTSFTNITSTLPLDSQVALVNLAVRTADEVWVVLSGYSANDKAYKSLDGGATWINVSAGLPNIPMNTIVLDTAVIGKMAAYIGADIGVYYQDSTTANVNTPYMTNLPNVSVRDLEIFYPGRKLRAATYGRGVWQSPLQTLQPLYVTEVLAGSVAGESNLLTWNSLADVAEYEVLRSNDGTTFTKIGTVSNTGSNALTFTDSKPINGANHYQLKANLAQGQSRNSNKILLVNSNNAFEVYPNPAQNILNVNYNAASYALRLLGTNGTVYYTVDNAKNLHTIDVRSMASGNYVLEIVPANGSKISKIVTINK